MTVAVVIASEMGEWESTVTYDFHLFSTGAGIGDRNVGTRGGRVDAVGGVASGMRTGREIFLIAPLLSRKAESTVVVGPFCWANACGSQIVGWYMHKDCSGRCWGLDVGVEGPSHQAWGSLLIFASFVLGPVQLPWRSPPMIWIWCCRFCVSLARAVQQ
jgi:hypothetical protein